MSAKVHFTGIPTSILKGAALREMVREKAEEIAGNARSQGHLVEGVPGDIEMPVEVTVYDTDRARASVIIKHPSGLAIQAKHGVLTRAAAEAGLEVVGE